MNAKTEQMYQILKAQLPEGWTCEVAWSYRDTIHLVPANRRGGVIVQQREIRVQLPDDGPCASYVYIKDGDNLEFKGPGWQNRIVQAAVLATFAFTSWDPNMRLTTTYVKAVELRAALS